MRPATCRLALIALGASMSLFGLTSARAQGALRFKWTLVVISADGEVRPRVQPTGGAFALAGTSWRCSYGSPRVLQMKDGSSLEALDVACLAGNAAVSITTSCEIGSKASAFSSMNLSEKGGAAHAVLLRCEPP